MNYELLVLTRRKKRKSFNHVYNFCAVLTLVLYASMSYLGWNKIFEISNTSWLTGHMINCILNECGRAERENINSALGYHCTRSKRNDRELNIFLSGPFDQSINKVITSELRDLRAQIKGPVSKDRIRLFNG